MSDSLSPLKEYLTEQGYTDEDRKQIFDSLEKERIRSLAALSLYENEELLSVVGVSGFVKIIQAFFAKITPKPKYNVKNKSSIFNSRETNIEVIKETYAEKEKHWNTEFQKLSQFKFEVKFFVEKGKYYCPIRDDNFELDDNAKISNAKRSYEGLSRVGSQIETIATKLVNRLAEMYKVQDSSSFTKGRSKAMQTVFTQTLIEELKEWEENNKSVDNQNKRKRNQSGDGTDKSAKR
jgi:hypothetical protein